MSKKLLSQIVSPRSRAPIDEEGIKLWNNLSEANQYADLETQNNVEQCIDGNNENHDLRVLEPKTKDKSTNTRPESESNSNKAKPGTKPKDIVLKKWRERQSKSSYELAKKAIINCMKEKFSSYDDIDRVVYRKDTIADVEKTSNSNVNRFENGRRKRKVMVEGSRVDFYGEQIDGVCHAKFQGPGRALAQWEVDARASKAGATGGPRGTPEEMPVSY